MDVDKIILECIARRKAAPARTMAEIITEVMDEVAAWKVALRTRAEFKTVPIPSEAERVQTELTQLAAK